MLAAISMVEIGKGLGRLRDRLRPWRNLERIGGLLCNLLSVDDDGDWRYRGVVSPTTGTGSRALRLALGEQVRGSAKLRSFIHSIRTTKCQMQTILAVRFCDCD